MLPFCPSPFLNKSFSSNVLSTEDLNTVFLNRTFLIKVLFIKCSPNKDLSIQFFLNRSFFLNKSSTVGRTSPQHISLIVSTSNCYVEIKRMSALWFTFGRVLSDLEGSILGNSTNPLGVRWGRSDSERCSPPSSFPSVHLLTKFPFFYTLDVDFTSHFPPFRTQESLLRRVSSPFHHFSFTFCNLRST